MRTEPIRIETDRVKKVRKYVESTRQTISGFIALAIDEKFERDREPKVIEERYFEASIMDVKPWMIQDINPLK